MELISEVYQVMRDVLKMTNGEMAEVFAAWNRTELDSYLIEITSKILGYQNEAGEEVIDFILDAAGQKGTGKWTAISALDEGISLTLITEAVFARCLSAVKEKRVAASAALTSPAAGFEAIEPR